MDILCELLQCLRMFRRMVRFSYLGLTAISHRVEKRLHMFSIEAFLNDESNLLTDLDRRAIEKDPKAWMDRKARTIDDLSFGLQVDYVGQKEHQRKQGLAKVYQAFQGKYALPP